MGGSIDANRVAQVLRTVEFMEHYQGYDRL